MRERERDRETEKERKKERERGFKDNTCRLHDKLQDGLEQIIVHACKINCIPLSNMVGLWSISRIPLRNLGLGPNRK